MNVGVCYFPEHWPSERVETDVEQMAEAGLEYVRMGEFAWSTLEPEPGEFDFDWLDRAIECIGEHDMQAVLCTPTATPPKWLVDEHPDILQAEADGTTRHYGGRRHYCFNSSSFREEGRRITRKLAERYADSPTVAGWQTDNEYGCHGTIRCYCDDCASAFRDWLREKYGDVETLNESWGTAFWSQRLRSFDEVDPPRHTAAGHHPSRLLDYYRFASDSVVEFNREQVEVLRDANDDWFVTHNFMSRFDTLDTFDLCADLDFASWDSYPTGHVQVQRSDVTRDQLRAGDPDQVGFDHDLCRSAADAPLWIMEQQPGEINWPPYSTQPAEGAMTLWAHTAAAHGADTVSYFRWRRCLMGQEQYHSGLRERDGSPDRGYSEASDAADEFASIMAGDDRGDATPAMPDADVALLHDYDNRWALEIEPETPDFDYWAHLDTYYRALRERSMTVDVRRPTDDLSEYAMAVAPTLYLADDDLADSLESFVAGAGHLLLTMRSGIKDPHNKLHDAAQPGPLSDLVGATVADHESVPADLASDVHFAGETHESYVYNEWLATEDAEVVGRYQGEMADGEAAIVRNRVGDGSVTYVGTWPSPALAGELVDDIVERSGVDATEPLPPQVRLVRRDGLTWVVNYRSEPLAVESPGDTSWLVGDGSVEPFSAAVTDACPGRLDVGE